MTTFILMTLGIFLFLLFMYLIVRKSMKKKGHPRGDSIAKKMENMKEDEAKSHLGRQLFYKIKSGLLKK